MDRRKALKNMGLTLGYAVATPTLLNLMQSCKETAPTLEWTPDFFSKDQAIILTQLVDIILPKTDTPSASEVQVNLFIDKFANEVMEKEQQDFAKMVMDRFVQKTLLLSKKELVADLTSEDLETVLAKVLKVTKEQDKEYQEAIGDYMKAIKEGTQAELSDDLACYAYATQLRGMTIWGYKTSEYIGEEVLAYLPVPGEMIGCGDLETLTGGKAWSLG